MSRQLKAIIKSILNDLKADDDHLVEQVTATLSDPVVINLLSLAGCPEGIINAMVDTVPLSLLERRYCCKVILKEVKKIPERLADGDLK